MGAAVPPAMANGSAPEQPVIDDLAMRLKPAGGSSPIR